MRDIVLGIAFMVMGVFIVLTTLDYPAASSLAADPALFPRTIGIGLGAIGVLVALAGLRARRAENGDPTIEPAAGAPQADPSAGPEAPGDTETVGGILQSVVRVAPFVVSSGVYVWVALSSGLGYATSTFLFLTLVMIWLSRKKDLRSYVSAAALSGVISAALYATFIIGLGVPIPPGLLP